MKNESEREFQMDAIEVSLAQLNRRLARMEVEKKEAEKAKTVSPAEAVVFAKMDELEKRGKGKLANLLGIGFAVAAGLWDAFAEQEDASPLVATEARKWV